MVFPAASARLSGAGHRPAGLRGWRRRAAAFVDARAAAAAAFKPCADLEHPDRQSRARSADVLAEGRRAAGWPTSPCWPGRRWPARCRGDLRRRILHAAAGEPVFFLSYRRDRPAVVTGQRPMAFADLAGGIPCQARRNQCAGDDLRFQLVMAAAHVPVWQRKQPLRRLCSTARRRVVAAAPDRRSPEPQQPEPEGEQQDAVKSSVRSECRRRHCFRSAPSTRSRKARRSRRYA
jgi:hypothetical protein